eukprot:8849952-Pyramimonas_sp.AAC.3
MALRGNPRSKKPCRAFNEAYNCTRESCVFGHFCSACGPGAAHSANDSVRCPCQLNVGALEVA